MPKFDEQQKKLNIHIGNKILTTRIMLGITREELSKAINVSQQQLAKYEKGTNKRISQTYY